MFAKQDFCAQQICKKEIALPIQKLITCYEDVYGSKHHAKLDCLNEKYQ